MSLLAFAMNQAEQGRLPDTLLRAGIRRLCAARRRELLAQGDPARAADRFAEAMRSGPVAPVPDAANAQHYEVPAEFFALCLGPHRKYSSCLWPAGVNTLEAAEDAALNETCLRARLEDGMDILELGCGWGSLTLYMAARYPRSTITAVSNSASQREFIEAEARERGLANLRIVTCDMNDFHPEQDFDRVVSVEMFEHMRNYQTLLERVAEWLRPGGALFVHIFCHRSTPYSFETDGAANWMGRHFFTGGIMPSFDLFDRFADSLAVAQRWSWDGTHYQRTADAWLRHLDANKSAALSVLARDLPPDEARRQFHRWRIFFMACAELFGFDRGREWFVGHYLFEHAPSPEPQPAFAEKQP